MPNLLKKLNNNLEMETTTKPPAAKKIERIAFISFGIISLFIVTIVVFVKMKDREFLNKGVRVEATVCLLYTSRCV